MGTDPSALLCRVRQSHGRLFF